jgi:mannitol-1-phosphate/altronate dehydrogenase
MAFRGRVPDMPRKPKITRLAPEQRAFVEKLLREDRLTLSEMLDALRSKFPDANVSRSGLHRYQASMKEVTDRMRQQDAAARAIVAELGENPDERAGALLVQAVTTACTDVAMRANEKDDTTIDEVRKLARAAKDTIAARTTSLKERQAIELAARDRLVREQRSKLDALGKSGAISQEALAKVIKAAYDL